MYPETEKPLPPESGCNDSCGLLPECAPLAVPYVPFQQVGSKRYPQAEALSNGTLFPGLNLPFHMKTTAVPLEESHHIELQALQFVLLELCLYLDTHPDDSEAFALYQQYAALEAQARERYVSMHGPLMHRDGAREKTWNAWLRDPWPWNFPEGGAR